MNYIFTKLTNRFVFVFLCWLLPLTLKFGVLISKHNFIKRIWPAESRKPRKKRRQRDPRPPPKLFLFSHTASSGGLFQTVTVHSQDNFLERPQFFIASTMFSFLKIKSTLKIIPTQKIADSQFSKRFFKILIKAFLTILSLKYIS